MQKSYMNCAMAYSFQEKRFQMSAMAEAGTAKELCMI